MGVRLSPSDLRIHLAQIRTMPEIKQQHAEKAARAAWAFLECALVRCEHGIVPCLCFCVHYTHSERSADAENKFMGLTKVTVTLSNLGKSKKPYEALFLVDTGATDCLAPRSKLLKAGIKPEGKDAYELANGQPAEYEYGFARVAFMGFETVTQVVFGPEDVEPLLGAVALESAGIGVDPITRTLKKMPAKPLK